MKCLLFAGAPDTGKSSSISLLAKYLIKQEGFKLFDFDQEFKSLVEGKFTEEKKGEDTITDVAGILIKDKTAIIIQSYNDDLKTLKGLIWRISVSKEILTNLGIENMIVISANRNRTDRIHEKTIKNLSDEGIEQIVEIPLGRMIRGKKRDADVNWYLNSIQTLSKNLIDMLLFPSH